MNYTTKKYVGKTIYHIFCIFLCVVMLYPLLWLFGSAFKESSEIFTNSAKIFPSGKWYFENFVSGWAGFGGITFGTFFKNSIIVSCIATLGAVVSSAIISYGFARISFAGSKFWFGCMLISLMLPFQVIMVPQYLLFSKLGMIGTYLPLILPYFFGQAFFIFLDVQFIQGLPIELDESAKIDGCNRFQIFTKIIVPLIVPAMMTTAIFSFIWRWDDFSAPLIYLSKPSMYVVSIALKNFSDPSSMSNWGGMFAMSVLSLLPAVLIYVMFQKYLVEGIATTGMKN